MKKNGISVIIPTWNGWHLLKNNLPYLLDALRRKRYKHEVIVVDDGSTDGTSLNINKEFPKVRVIRFETNKGFVYACNEGIMKSRCDIVYLLNNDVIVEKDFIDNLLPHFKNDNVFAVTSSEWDKTHFTSIIHYRYGIFSPRYVEIKNLDRAIPSLFASGGHSAFDKEKFLALGGFDALYYPFYWEDIDISYRAWKHGWEILYEPKSRIRHQHRSTIARVYSDGFISGIYWRNMFLFTWRNIMTRSIWIKHLSFLPLELIVLPLIGKGHFFSGFLQALTFIGVLNEKRKKDMKSSTYSDEYVRDRINRYLQANIELLRGNSCG
jgi:GT2 family glycosyltransferase